MSFVAFFQGTTPRFRWSCDACGETLEWGVREELLAEAEMHRKGTGRFGCKASTPEVVDSEHREGIASGSIAVQLARGPATRSVQDDASRRGNAQ